ncbi:MAG: UMP kinase [Candidatus Methanospirareceae archaeon]
MKVVISLSGIFFSDAETIRNVAEVLEELAKSCNLYVVTGGGERAREYINIARELDANEALCDYMGIALTRINAKLLISALRTAYPEPFLDYKDVAVAKVNGSEEQIAVMGGVSPGYTTDAVAAILAEYVNANLLLDVTSVDGVYDADPHINPTAKKYDKLSPKELVALTMKGNLKAGARIVIDPVAAKIIERSGIKTIVIDGSNPRAIIDAVHGKHQGTEIS